jgi:cytochrome c-type biogenesis protein CcmH/NrfG
MRFITLVLLLSACLTASFPAWSASGLFDQDRVMVANARLSDAEEMLQQWLAGHPEDQEARFLLARVLAWQEKHTEALTQYDHLLKNDPNNGDYLAGRAMLPVTARTETASGLANGRDQLFGIPSQR